MTGGLVMTDGLVMTGGLVTALEERSAGGSGAAELAPERRHERLSAVLVDRLGAHGRGLRQAAVARSPRDARCVARCVVH